MPLNRQRRRSSRRMLTVATAFLIALLGFATPMVAYADPTPTPSETPSATPTPTPDEPAAKKADPSPTPTPSDTATPDNEDASSTPSPSAAEKPSPEPSKSADKPAVEPSPSDTPTPTATTADKKAAAEDDPEITPQIVPPATGNNAVITVKVGGNRTSLTGVGDLAGVTLGFYDTATGTTPAFTCVSDADGDCSIIVPNTQAGLPPGANRDRRFYVRQIATAPGYYTNPNLGTGTTVAPDTYQFQTGAQLRNGNTYSSTVDFMISTGTTNNEASGGIWQNSRNNPSFPAKCGINVALVLDLSGSVGGDLPNLKNAANTFVNSLTGTPSSVGVFTFATSAPAAGAANTTLPLTPVSTSASAATVTSKINGLTLGTGQEAGTNWDRGIYQVAQSTSTFDVAVVITDGNPTFYAAGEGPGNRTRFREVENGIFSANAVKAEGTKVIGFGVGAGIGNTASGLNLRSISGPTLNTDYYQTTDYSAAADQLKALALGNCTGSITVVKEVVPSTAPPGSTTGASPTGGWTFTGIGSPGITVTPPTSRTTATGTGAANFPLTFAGGTTSGPVTLTETQQAGYTLQQVGGANAVCTRVDTSASVPVTNSGATGFTATAASTYPVSCIVYNRAPSPAASVVLNKAWVVNGTTYAEGSQPPELVASGTIDGTNQPWGTPRTGFQEGASVALDESLGTLPAQCTVDSSRLTSANGTAVNLALPSNQTLASGTNTYGITNTLTCPTKLSLDKTVRFGTASPSSWTLTAIAPVGGSLPGPSGTDGVTGTVTPGVTYTLREDGGDPAYLQVTAPTAVLRPGATGSMFCVEVAADGTTVIPGFADGLNGGVTVPFGSWVRCRAINETASLRLVKEVINDNGGTAVPSDWNLTATPTTGTFPPGLPTQTRPGAALTDAQFFNVRPGVGYSLSESTVPGYNNTAIECQIISPRQATQTVTLQPGDVGTCYFVNNDQPASLTLRKVVDNGTAGGNAAPADWTLTAVGGTPTTTVTGPGNSAQVTSQSVPAGTYALSESGGPPGYSPGTWSCGDTVMTDATHVTVPLNGNVTCEITNTAIAPTLTLVKQVDPGTTGDTTPATAWTLTAENGDSTITGVTGSSDVTAATAIVGTYTLSEDGPDGFDRSDWVCTGGTAATATSVTLSVGDGATCTIVNTALQPRLTLVKRVINDNGGTAIATDWTLSADGPTPISGTTGSPGVTGAAVAVGEYLLDESALLTGYARGDWSCDGGSLDGRIVTIAVGDDVTCTIVNNDLPAHLTLVKTVNNDNGGTAVDTDWTLSADGPTPISGATGDPTVTGAEVDAGDYILSETGGPDGYTAGDWSCGEGVQMDDDVVAVPSGGDVTCTITNTADQAFLTLVKTVSRDNGGTAVPTDWTLRADGPTMGVLGRVGDAAVTHAAVQPGDYDLTEFNGPDGYTPGDWSCVGGSLDDSTVTVALGEDVTCTIDNDDDPATLTLVKVVDNGTTGSTAAPADWTLTAAGPTPISGAGNSASVTDQTVDAGDYPLSESGGPDGYTPSAWSCTGGTLDGSTVTVPNGGNVTCTITNTAEPVSLTLVKVVENGTTGATAVETDWTLTAAGPVTVSGATGSGTVTGADVEIGTYDLSETGPAGYDSSDWVCTGATDSSADSVTLARGDDATCTITNTAIPPHLTLVKEVENNFGGTAVKTAWTLSADGPTPIDGVTGTDAVTGATVQVGDYKLDETGPGGYARSAWDCGDATMPSAATVTVPVGADVTCTITNSDQPAHLTLTKVVDPDSSGTEHVPADWTLTATPQDIDGQDTVSGNGDPTSDGGVNAVEVFSGRYQLSEDGPAGFEGSLWECTGGVVEDDVVTVPSGGNVDCTITNTAIAPRLTLVKQVTNDNGGTAVDTDWTLSADGASPISGVTRDPSVTDAAVQVGTYDLSESGPPDYTASAWTCADAQSNPVTVTGSSVTLAEGDDVTCTIVNDDNPPSWSIIKVSDPESGATVQPGQEITYVVGLIRNEGVDPTNVVVTDDLSQVLNNATLVDGPTASTGTATISGTTMTWTVPVLSEPIEVVTYTVRVKPDAYGVTLQNVATSPGSSPCDPDEVGELTAQRQATRALAVGPTAFTEVRAAAAEDDELCPDSTNHHTPNPPAPPTPPSPEPLPNTGGPTLAMLGIGFALLVGGSGLMLWNRRRRQG